MNESFISVKEFAETNGLHRQTVFRVLKRLNIEQSKLRGGSENRGQTISYITKQDAVLILDELRSSKTLQRTDNKGKSIELPDATLYDIGVFYLLCLEPEHDPHRFKVSFASNINDRLRQHRCAAPYTKVIKTWACRRLWEKTAIECVTQECERLHTEVFRANSLDAVETKCEQFFALMPQLNKEKD